jgi:hypothetical protein
MTVKEQLIQEIEEVPDLLLEELLDFLMFIKTRRVQEASVVQSSVEEANVEVLDQTSQEYKPIWKVAEELVADIPLDVLEKLPRDGAINHDHYLYGSPKREE